ncbi:vacuolar (H+)-ATPase G subunit domain-containing protein [Ditylenchus destructor]|uniref:V-type proton ATPase subunit G n=1 Tax=Ditylenchus destructor TaxID=166010 RepID=A0AAD4N5Y8_9BILA|nr:vacuolar (H+)-ATPase G subunit domain-containing protein [Ditylenchus destructor]
MASQTAGIQQLLAAEKRAAEKINESRKRKAQRLKQAKQEAQADIEKYRQEREKHFKDYEQQYLGTKEDIELGIRKETEGTLKKMEESVAHHKQEVIVRLLQLVCDIRPELHHNLQLQTKLQKEGKLGGPQH